MTAAAATPRAAEHPVCICFEHVGAQDKPMPEFCLSSDQRPTAHALVHVDAATLRRVAQALQAAPAPADPGQPGSYRVTPWPCGPMQAAPPQAQGRIVAAAQMRGLALSVLEAARAAGTAPPAVIEQLRLRLGN